MELPPLIWRELRLQAQGRWTWWMRVLVVALTNAPWVLPLVVGRSPIQNGKYALLAMAAFPLLLASFGGIVTTADSISREKREHTLESLLLTEISPLEIVLQKLIAGSSFLFFGLLGIMPLFALPVLLGGVAPTDAVLVALATMVIAFLSSTAGCLVSSLAKSALASVTGTFLLMGCVLGGSFALKAIAPGSALYDLLACTNPMEIVSRTLFSAGKPPGWIFCAGALSSGFTLGGIFLVGASVAVRTGVIEYDRKIQLAPAYLVVFGGIGAVLMPLAFTITGLPLLAALLFFNTSAKLLIALLAVPVLNSRQWLELLVTTPMDLGSYSLSEAGRLARGVTLPMAGAVAVNVIVLTRLNTPYFEAGIAAFAFLLLDAVTLLFVGLWSGLKHIKVSTAIAQALGNVFLVPLGISFVFVLFGFETSTMVGAIFLWGLLCLLVDIVSGVAARWMIANQGRQVATLIRASN